MGYSYATFTQLAGFIPKPCRVLDVGSQDITVNNTGELREVNRFVARYGGASIDVRPRITLTARAVYQAAGFDYTCTDVDHKPGTLYVDLQRLTFPKSLRDAFDLVVNAGTTEHLANPIAGFAFIHYCTRPAGLMFHDVPLFGWGNHGLMNPTPKFWHALIAMNGYEVIAAHTRHVEESDAGRGNFMNDAWTIEGLGELNCGSSMISIALRKTTDRVFMPPFDVEAPSWDAWFIRSALEPFIATGVYSAAEVDDSLLAYQGHQRAISTTPIHKRIARLVRCAMRVMRSA